MIRTFNSPCSPDIINDPVHNGTASVRLYFIPRYPAEGPLEIHNVDMDLMRKAMAAQDPEEEVCFKDPTGRFYNFRRKYIKRWITLDAKE